VSADKRARETAARSEEERRDGYRTSAKVRSILLKKTIPLNSSNNTTIALTAI